MTDTVKPAELKRIVLLPGENGFNIELLTTIEKLRHPIGRSRAWTAKRLIENSQIFQDALTVSDEDITTLALQLCIVRKHKVDKVAREPGVLKMSDLDPLSDIRSAHDRMTAKVR